MPAGARLLGVEHVLPEGAGQASGKLTDVNMMVIAGGRERTEAEYRRLFAAHGFRPTRVVPTRGRQCLGSRPGWPESINFFPSL